MKKRILYYGMSSSIGGIETFLFQLANNLYKKNFQINFLLIGEETPCFYKELLHLDCRFFKITPRKKNLYKHLKELNDLFEKEHFDILHFNVVSLSYISPVIVALKYGCKVIVHSHNSKLSSGLVTQVLNKINYLRIPKNKIIKFACSRLAAYYLFGKHTNKSDIIILKNAINTEEFIYNPIKRELTRRELCLENKFVIGHVGRFEALKNHGFLIDIFKKIHEKNNTAVLLLIGDGTLRSEIEQKIEVSGLKNDVIFAGIRSDVPDLLCAMDLFLFPSLGEGLGIVLIEAQANGLHCVVSNVLPNEVKITDLIEYVSLNESPAHWADRVIVYMNGYERKNMQTEIKQAGFDMKEMSQSLEEFYLKQLN